MKKSTFKLAFWATILGLFLYLPSMAQTAVVVDSVSTIHCITNTTAFTGSWMSDFGPDQYVLDRGVCYGTSENPTIDDNKVPAFKSSVAVPYEPAYLEGLMPNTTYYARAYATDPAGATVYSPQKSFTTTNNAEVIWQLAGATQFDAAVTGALSADPLYVPYFANVSGWDKNNGKDISIGSDYLKIQPAGNQGGGSDEVFNDSIYFGFNVTPKADVDFTVKSLSLVCSGYKSGGAKLAFTYSLDDFATEDSLGMGTLGNDTLTQARATVSDPIKPGSGSLDNEFANIGQMYISFSPDIEVPAGKTLSIRMYSWNKHDFTLLMKDVVISGEATTSLVQGDAVVDSVAAFTSITNTTAFTGGWVSDFGPDAYLLERGVCYGTSENPTIVNNTSPSWKSAFGYSFEPAYLEGLTPNTKYYVRAYAKNNAGVSYSPQKSFITTDNPEVLWQLSGKTLFNAATTGDITADSMYMDTVANISGWDKNGGRDISLGEDYFKVTARGSDGETFDPDVYFGFKVGPKPGFDFTVKKFNLNCFGYKTGDCNLAFAYSLDDFATQDSLGLATLNDVDKTQARGTVSDPIRPGSGSIDNEFATMGKSFISFSPNIVIPQGKKLSVRMYIWGKHDITIEMKDVVISGETSVSTVVLSNDANLTGITLDPVATLNPAFSSDVTNYTVELPTGTSSVNIGVTKSDDKANVSGDGNIDVSSGTRTAKIVVTAEDGSTKTYTIVFTVITDVNNLSADFSIYPNPATSFVNIEGLRSKTSIAVFNSNGKLIQNIIANNNNYQLDVSSYQVGIYIVKMVSTNKVYTSTFIKK